MQCKTHKKKMLKISLQNTLYNLFLNHSSVEKEIVLDCLSFITTISYVKIMNTNHIKTKGYICSLLL